MKPTILIPSARLAFAMLLASAAHAAPPQLPADARLAHEMRKQAARSAAAISSAERQSPLLHQLVPDVGSLTAVPSPDPAAIASRYQGPAPRTDSALFILVSFSMPSESIERLAAQAGSAGATLVLRGVIDDSLKRTAEVVAEFVKKYPATQFQIDPTLFRRFAVTQVPAFVLSTGQVDSLRCGKHCDAGDTYASVAGDVTLDYALDYLARQHEPRFAALAERRLKQLRGTL